MQADPLVSVVIPTYRRSALVLRAIRSVLAQTYPHLEIIVVDDCSPDDTQTALTQISDARVRCIRHEKNRGLPAARNSGIREAIGAYVAFLDDDDEWRPHKLERQLAIVGRYDVVLCASLVNGVQRTRYGKERITLADLRKGNRFAPSGLLAKTSVLRDLWFDENLRVGEDWDAYIRIAEKYHIGYSPEPLVIYYQQGQTTMTSESRNLTIAELERRMSVIKKHEAFFGPFWTKYHKAFYLLSFVGERNEKLKHIRAVTRQCGVIPVATVLLSKIGNKARLAVSTPRVSQPLLRIMGWR